jgi:hypothetical protein
MDRTLRRHRSTFRFDLAIWRCVGRQPTLGIPLDPQAALNPPTGGIPLILSHSTRRWLAGLGVAGAFVAASATPAVAAEAPFKVVAQDMLVAPGYGTMAYLYAASTDDEHPHQFGQTSLDFDFSGIAGFSDFEVPGEGWGWACETNGQTAHCETEFGENDGPWLGLQVFAHDDAKPGQDGQLKYSITSGGHTVRAASTVTIAEGVDLQTAQTLSVSGAPGSQVGAPVLVRNGGETTSHGAVLVMSGDYLYNYAGDFTNCVPNDMLGTVCTFDEDLKPGKSYRLSEDLPFELSKDARTGAELLAGSVWWTKDDWDLLNRNWTQDVDPDSKPGTKATLHLVEVAEARSLSRQTDPDQMNNFTDISVKVTGNNPADLAVEGATAKGR